MKTLSAIILTTVSVIVSGFGQPAGDEYATPEPKVRFAPLHVYLDTGRYELAAFQFELRAEAGRIKIVGVEGGEHAAFAEPPYYDPAALANDRIIIAAFDTGGELPSGRTRIATVHLQIIGDAEPEYQLKLTVAADPDGEEVPAEITYDKGERR